MRRERVIENTRLKPRGQMGIGRKKIYAGLKKIDLGGLASMRGGRQVRAGRGRAPANFM